MQSEKRLENIEHDGVVPVKIFYFKKVNNTLAQMVMPHWHRDIELDYLVKGNTVMNVRGVRHEVKTGDAGKDKKFSKKSKIDTSIDKEWL